MFENAALLPTPPATGSCIAEAECTSNPWLANWFDLVQDILYPPSSSGCWDNFIEHYVTPTITDKAAHKLGVAFAKGVCFCRNEEGSILQTNRKISC